MSSSYFSSWHVLGLHLILLLSQINYAFSFILLLKTKIHCFYIISRHTFGEQREGLYILFSQENILSLLLQNYYSGSSPGAMSLFPYSPDTDNLLLFHMGDSWAPSSGKCGTNLFFRAGSCESWAGLGQWPAEHCRADVPRLQPKANTPFAPPFPAFSKENQSFCTTFGKYRHSSKAGSTQQISKGKKPLRLFWY